MFVFPCESDSCANLSNNSDLSDWTDSKEKILKENYPLHRMCRDGDADSLKDLLIRVLSNISSLNQSEFGSRLSVLSSQDPFYGWVCYFIDCFVYSLSFNASML